MPDDPRFKAVQSMLLRWGYTPAKAVNHQTIQLLAAADAVDPLRQTEKPAETVPAAVFTPEMRDLLITMGLVVINMGLISGNAYTCGLDGALKKAFPNV